MRRRSLLPLLVILMFLFPLLQAGNSPAKGLDGRQQSMVLVAAYTANGDLERLRPALGQALDAGLTINEMPPLPCPPPWTGMRTAPVSGPTLPDKRRSSPRPASWLLPRSSIPF